MSLSGALRVRTSTEEFGLGVGRHNSYYSFQCHASLCLESKRVDPDPWQTSCPLPPFCTTHQPHPSVLSPRLCFGSPCHPVLVTAWGLASLGIGAARKQRGSPRPFQRRRVNISYSAREWNSYSHLLQMQHDTS